MLPEERRAQLDGIVTKMASQNAPKSDVQAVVGDFTSRYAVEEEKRTTTLGQKITTGATAISDFLGAKGLTDFAGAKIAKATLPKEQRQFVSEPTAKEVVGSGVQFGATFLPYGAIAKTVGGAVRALGVGKKVGGLLGVTGAGTTGGYAVDVGAGLQEGESIPQALKPGVGTAIGAILPPALEGAVVATRVAQKATANAAPRIINSLIKPLLKDFSYGKNPGRAVANEGIVANSLDELADKIRSRRNSVGQEIDSLGTRITESQKQLSIPTIQVEKSLVTPLPSTMITVRESLKPIDEAIKKAIEDNMPDAANRLNGIKRALTTILIPQTTKSGKLVAVSAGSKLVDNLTWQQARKFKTKVGDLTAFTGNPTDDKLVNAALKRVYGQIKEEMERVAERVGPKFAKETKRLNELYADLSSAEIATTYRDKIQSRQNLVGLTPTIAGLGSAVIALITTGGAALPAVLFGVGGAALDKALSSPYVKTRVARWLAKASPEERSLVFSKAPQLEGAIGRVFQNSPGDVVARSPVGGAIKDYAKNPKLGLQLEDVSKKNIPKELEPIAEEARKYKTVEEFVKAQPAIYHGTPNKFSKFAKDKMYGGRAWFSDSKKAVEANNVEASRPAGSQWNVMERFIKPNIKIADRNVPEIRKLVDNEYTDSLIAKGYRGIKHEADAKRGSYVEMFFPNEDTFTKSQLTDIWKRANKADPLTSSISKAKASGQSFDEWVKGQGETVFDDFVKTTPEYKAWAKNSDNIIEAYHGTPYSFDKFEIGKKQAGAYELEGISFATKKELAEPFSRQYPDWYYAKLKELQNKYPDISKIESKAKVLENGKKVRSVESIKKEGQQWVDSLNKEWEKDKEWLYNNNYEKFRKRREGTFKIIDDLKEELVRSKNYVKPTISAQESKVLANYNKELQALDDSVQGNIYKVFIKGKNIIDEVGEDIGFSGTRNSIVAQLDGDILRIKNADTGQYIGEEIIINDPKQIFMVNSSKTHSQLKAEWDGVDNQKPL